MNLQPKRSNELVQLRPLESNDFNALFQVAQDPLIWEQHPCPDRYLPQPFTAFFEDSLQSGGALVVIDQLNGKIIGSSRFKSIIGAPEAVEIGWSFLARAYWGGTYNRAVKELMIAYAFEYLEDVVFYIGKENIRSQRAVSKIGGELVQGPAYAHLIADKTNDLCFRINRSRWRRE
ncbi:MAG: GNAT family N-acetyltransferase [Saprospiraceae bacterium]|nr:GNAT family N-acetyltransferase [Saprospiraceae bacterium]